MPIPKLLQDFGYYRKPRLLNNGGFSAIAFSIRKQVNAIAILNFREYAKKERKARYNALIYPEIAKNYHRTAIADLENENLYLALGST